MRTIEISSTFLRIYVTIFSALFVVNRYIATLTGIGFWKSLFLISLACVPISLVVLLILNQFSLSLINGLYGLGIKEDCTEEISNSEIMKLIPLKEQGQHETVLRGLATIEEQYGPSSRIIYERALCLMEMGELRKARRCVKDFLSKVQTQKHDDSYYKYCQQLISHKDAPLTLETINRRNKTERS